MQQVVVDGETSREEIVRSGVPQGTVLGPLMFLIFINDIGYNICSTIYLFADDALIYRYVNNKEDSDILQKDIDQLCGWVNKWKMSFNPSKCLVMSITRMKQLVISNYIMHGQLLSCAEHHPYLGLEIAKDLHLPFPDYLTPKSRTMRGEHTHCYTVVQTRTDVFKYSFFPRTIQCLNILPVTLIEKPSVDSFKTGLYTALHEGSIYLVQLKGVYDRSRLCSNAATWDHVLGDKKREPSKTCI